MEQLHPVAQVVGIIVIGICVCVALLAMFTTYFDKR
jgi:hypothetical protein